MGMYAHSSSLNFCRSREKKHQIFFKCHNKVGVKVQIELESKWKSYFECKQEKKNHKKLRDEILTYMDHEPSPLFDIDMQEVKPIAKLMDT